MKHTKMMKRVLLVLLTLVMLVGTLTSCGGGSAALDTVKKPGDGDGCKVYFARILTLAGAEGAREAFVAASRGYNMLAEGFNDALIGDDKQEDPKDPAAVTYTDENGTVYTVSMEGAKAAINLLKPKTESVGDATVFENDVNAMTPADVVAIVAMMRDIKVDLSGNAFPGVILEWIGAFLRLLTNLTGGYYVWALFFFAIVIYSLLFESEIYANSRTLSQIPLL